MVFEIVSFSSEIIKPSKPTPSHLKTFTLSLLDQLALPPYAPIVLFYPQNDAVSGLNGNSSDNDFDTVSPKLESLRTSLSETLTRFYPVAGTIGTDQLTVDCDDRGARFDRVDVNASLRDFLSEPDLNSSLHRLLPCEPMVENDFVSNIRVTVFLCGGISVGICISHKMLDGVALSSFLRSWSATSSSRGAVEVRPCLDTANTMFPANNSTWLRDASREAFGPMLKQGAFVTKRFVFGASAISRLKSEATTGSGPVVENTTRVEAVSAFIQRSVSNGRSSLSTHFVNLRKRTTPALPETSVGNLLWAVPAAVEGDVAELSAFVGSLRDSFSKVSDEFVRTLSSSGGDKGESLMAKCLSEVSEENRKSLVHVGFSSWCNFGFYEVDFGWGDPAWVSSYGQSGSVFMNLVVLVDTRVGRGIEAWVTLEKNDMTILENNPQLVKLGVLVDPIPI